jgi:hypothetical protein
MILKQLVVKVLGTGLFACSAVVLALSFATVASAREDEPPCPVCHSIMLTCDGSTCTCKQTGVNTGVWECRDKWPDDEEGGDNR